MLWECLLLWVRQSPGERQLAPARKPAVVCSCPASNAVLRPPAAPQIKELRSQVDHFREAHATVAREMEVGWQACRRSLIVERICHGVMLLSMGAHCSTCSASRPELSSALAHRPSRPCPARPAQARLAEAQGASARVEALEAESGELLRRLIEMKDREAERMNEINKLEADTVSVW